MDDHFIIKGTNRRRTLSGEISVRGAKNAALKIFSAALLFEDDVRVRNVPAIEDIAQITQLLLKLGMRVETRRSGIYTLRSPHTLHSVFDEQIAKRFRGSIVAVGPALARFGKISFPHPGGCLIGARPINMFLEGFRKMGARISLRGNAHYTLTAPKGGLHGASVFFKNQSVTGTETLMMAGSLARGKTVLRNAALEPEIEALARFLNACGAKIRGAGTSTIEITGTRPLHARKKVFIVPPDRIEAGSFLILGALAGKDLRIINCEPKHLEALLDTLRLSGVHIENEGNCIRVRRNASPETFRSIDIKTHEYPGFPTDLQAPATVFLTQTKGHASVFETIFEGRFRYVEDLIRMGADIDIYDPHRISVRGHSVLRGKELESPDLRAGLAYIIAAIIAKGESVIHNVGNIDRGYERIEERLQKIGVSIKRKTL